nr:hypothetical protein [uncultured Porphyromonas sp.]
MTHEWVVVVTHEWVTWITYAGSLHRPLSSKEMHNGKSNDQQVHPMNAQGDYASEAEAIA